MAAHRLGWPLAVAALTGLALVLTLHGLGDKSLVLDEATSIMWARQTAGRLWDVISGIDPNAGLYYLLLHGWVQVFGDGEGAARALGAVAGGLSVPALALLGARLFDWVTGLVAALLLALDGFFVEWAQTARVYPLVALLVIGSTYLFLRELERPSRWGWVGYVLVSSLAVWAHYFAAFVLVAHLLTLLVLRRRAALPRRWVGAGLAIAALCAPEVVFASRKGTEAISWIKAPTLHDVLHLPVEQAGGSHLLAAGLLALAAYAVLRRRRGREAWPTMFVAAWLVVPIALALAVSIVQPIFLPKYLVVTLPALLLLAAAGIVRLPGRALGAVVLAGVVGLSARTLSDWYGSPSREDYRDAAGHIARGMRPGDRVAYAPSFINVPLIYYWRRGGAPGPTGVDLVQARTARSGRVWLVTRGYEVDGRQQARLEAGLAGDRRAGPLSRFGQIRVVLLAPAA